MAACAIGRQESPHRTAPGSPSPRTKRSMQERCVAKTSPCQPPWTPMIRLTLKLTQALRALVSFALAAFLSGLPPARSCAA